MLAKADAYCKFHTTVTYNSGEIISVDHVPALNIICRSVVRAGQEHIDVSL